MKQVLLLLLMTALAGCGGVHKAKRDAGRIAPAPAAPIAVTPTVVGVTTPGLNRGPAPEPVIVVKPFAVGPINSACLASDRKARSTELCGCIQAVADKTLDTAEQRLAVSFYNDPQKAQDIRQSDNTSHEEFWLKYRAYGDQAERVCA